MRYKVNHTKAGIIALMIAAILCLHYFTLPRKAYIRTRYAASCSPCRSQLLFANDTP